MRAKEFLFETVSTGLGGGSAGKSGGPMVGGPVTFQQEYNKFKKKGPMQITAMTTEEVRTKVDTIDYELMQRIKFDPKVKQPRYLVFSQYKGSLAETDSIAVALHAAQDFAETEKKLDNHVLVLDRKFNMPVVSYRGSEDVWYKTHPLKNKLHEKWTKKYKKSINCSNPKGFSQKAHCAGRKARQAGKHTKSKSISEGWWSDRKEKKEREQSIIRFIERIQHPLASFILRNIDDKTLENYLHDEEWNKEKHLKAYNKVSNLVTEFLKSQYGEEKMKAITADFWNTMWLLKKSLDSILKKQYQKNINDELKKNDELIKSINYDELK